jgi:hypothetical protein
LIKSGSGWWFTQQGVTDFFAYIPPIALLWQNHFPNYFLMKSPLRLTIIFLLMTTFSVFAQKQYEEGYVITASQDTLRGMINYLNWSKNPESIQFKSSSQSSEQVFGLEEIAGFFVHGEHYVKAMVKVDDTPTKVEELTYARNPETHEQAVFLRALIRGPKELYYFKGKKENFYIRQGTSGYELLVSYRYKIDHTAGESIITVDTFKEQLSNYLADCQEVSAKTKTLVYTSGALIKFVNSYYSKCSVANASVKSEAEPFEFRFGATVGGNVSKYTFGGPFAFWLRKPQFSTSYRPTFGLSADIIFPRTRKRMSFYNDLLFVSTKTRAVVYDEIGFPMNTETAITIGYDFLRLTTLFRYKLPIQSGGVFFNLGIANGVRVGKTDRLVRSYSFGSSDQRITETEALSEMRTYQQGRIVGIGGFYKKVSLELRYSGDSGVTYGGIRSNGKSGYVLLGYHF